MTTKNDPPYADHLRAQTHDWMARRSVRQRSAGAPSGTPMRTATNRRLRRPRIGLALVAALSATVLVAVAVFAVFSDTGPVNIQVSSNTQCSSGATTGGARVDYFGDNATCAAAVAVGLGSSGTGVFKPFVRIQASPSESGYDTNGTLQFDTKTGTWTHAILVSQIPQRPCDPTSSSGALCFELFNDINESSGQISLNKVDLWFTDSATLTGYPFTPSATTHDEYTYNGSIQINDVNSGSGRADIRYAIPLADVNLSDAPNCSFGNPACATYFVLYSQWGSPTAATAFSSDGGFEEWKVKTYPLPPPTLKLVKSVVNDNGGTATAANWTLTATGTSAGFSDAGNSTTFHTVTAGVQYTLSESSVANYTAGTVWSCVGGGTFATPNKITLSVAESATCTITNNDIPPKLHLRKVVTNDNGGTATVADFTLTATGGVTGNNLSGTSPVDSGATLKADTWALSESGPAGYTASDWSCVGGSQSGSNITVGIGGSATCTITNSDNKASPVIKTAQGWELFDTANFTGILAGAPDASSATVTFRLWSTDTGGVCSGQIGTDKVESLTGSSATTSPNDGIVVNPTISPTTFYWTADYSGDQFNNPAASPCGTETTTIAFAQPTP